MIMVIILKAKDVQSKESLLTAWVGGVISIEDIIGTTYIFLEKLHLINFNVSYCYFYIDLSYNEFPFIMSWVPVVYIEVEPKATLVCEGSDHYT